MPAQPSPTNWPIINGGLGWFGALQDTPQPAASCDASPAQYSDWELKAAHWKDAALTCSADAAVHCFDYAAHIRIIIECLRMDMMEKGLKLADA